MAILGFRNVDASGFVKPISHVSGGVSAVKRLDDMALDYFPREWGCFYDVDTYEGLTIIFPT